MFAVRHFNSAILTYFDTLDEAKYYKLNKGNRSIQYIILHEEEIKDFLLSRIKQKEFNRMKSKNAKKRNKKN